MNIYQAIIAVGHDEDFQPRPALLPTASPAGSQERIEVMRRRVEMGEDLYHKDDSEEMYCPERSIDYKYGGPPSCGIRVIDLFEICRGRKATA